ncbi:MAG: bifunctional glutamate N-acetyltransferase/amino-acid acetyltransferase ArgJ [Alphaproteobacteria bacterium]|nr:bifunctional glutamate N-acetyltransferase/amino-acid acetyltransferase ArgJ [Alphaproteobacteria bacterium]
MSQKSSKAKVSPLAPGGFPAMPVVAGVRLASGACGLKKSGTSDLLFAELPDGTSAAGVFTQSLTASAPVQWSRKALRGGQARGLVVNSGGANVFTGPQGMQAVEETVEAAADLLATRPSKIFAASTGVIGEPLAVEKIIAVLPDFKAAQMETGAEPDWEGAARAIMTTDTFPKGATAKAKIGGVSVTINGIAKGSGMIHPNMATMLGFMFTDAALSPDVLQPLLEATVNRSFNAITVDSDTSTSDTVMLFATGAAEHGAVDSTDDPALDDFKDALDRVATDLAHQIVRDGEGATKFITVAVTGAESEASAKIIAFSIATSPLVKTAIAGEDANWGRIVMAVGKAGEPINADRLTITIGGIPVAVAGGAIPGFDETPVAEHMKGSEITIAVDVGLKDVEGGSATVWTCDLTHEYIAINADYRS